MCARRRVFRLVTILLFLLAGRSASGQTTGGIAGVVKDPSGAAVSGAEVSVISQRTGDRRRTHTDESGNYFLPLLSPGLYRVSFFAAGFSEVVAVGVPVGVTETTLLNAELRVAPQADTVKVTAPAALVQGDGAQLGRIVNSREIAQLPLATRNITQILGLSPGTATYLPDNTGVGRNTQTISVNGARLTQNNYEFNGVDANTMGTSSAVNVAVPAPESVEEFKVQTSLYDATFGRAGGGNIQVITRTGTNSFHGTLYEYLRDGIFNANNPFLNAAGVPRPELLRNVFGAAVGGPIRRERAFFFLSYQGSREDNGASLLNSVSSNVLIAPGLTGDRSEATLLQTFQPKLPNGLPATAIDPAALALLNARLPNGHYLIPTPQVDGRFSGSTISRFQEDQLNANLNVHFSNSNSASARIFFANAPSELALPSFRGTGPNVPGFGTRNENDVRVIVLQDVHIFGAQTYNEFRLGYNRQSNGINPREPITDSEVGIQRPNANELPGLPLIRIAPAAGGVIIGTPTNINPAFPSVTTLNDTVVMIRGRHAWKLGAEFRYNEVNFASRQLQWGQIDFSSFNDFLVGATTLSTLGNGIGDRSLRAVDYNFYIQDDWKISSHWVLNLGLRYELDLPPYDTRGRFSTFDPSLYRPAPPDSSGNPTGPPAGGFVQAGNVIPAYDLPQVPNVSKRIVNSIDPNNVAPRIGFAYSPLSSGRAVIRGGYGIYYSRSTFQYASTSVTVPPTYLLATQRAAALDNPFFPVPPQSHFPTFAPGIPLSGTVPDRAIRTPYIQQYNLSLQRQLTNDMLFELAYVGTRGMNLFRQLAINQAVLASPGNPVINEVTGAVITSNSPANASLRAPFQGVGINNFFQNQSTAQSSYNSLQINLIRHFSRGLQFLASYTLAKSLDNGSGQGGGAGIAGVVNPGAVADTSTTLGNQHQGRANRGVSDFDRTHRFVLSYIWDLPAFSHPGNSRAARALLSHWRVAGIFTAMSGLPIDIVDTGAGSLYGLSGGSAPLARPSLALGRSCSAATTGAPPGDDFNPFAFRRPVVPAGQPIPSSGGSAFASATGTDLGNVGRNCLRGPGQVNLDFAIGRSVPLKESRELELRVEFFNLFNHPNLANPISDMAAVTSSGGSLNAVTGEIIQPGAFGRIISMSANPRIIQLAFKFNF